MKNQAWLRWFFLLVLLQALLVGSSLVKPEWIALVLPWPASPLNARFTGALYCMGAISAALCMFARSFAAVRISLIEIGVVTGGLLLITVPHFGEFTAANFPGRWTVFYTIDPLATAVLAWVFLGREPVPPGRNPYRALFLTYAGVLTVAGLALLLAPSVAVRLWPWALPPILGQVYSVFFLTFAVGGLLCAREPRWLGIWVYCAANAGMLLLVLAVSLVHRARFGSGPATWIWFGLCLMGLAAFALPLLRRPKDIDRQEGAA